jgi:phosphoglycerate dehydrogenase-like enzyme
VESVSRERVFRDADVVSLHVPLCAETVGMVRRQELSWMRPGAILINTSRGPVVDEEALCAALQEGRLAGAALDVLCHEPGERKRWAEIPPLVAYARTHQNLLLTPHIGGATHESMARTEVFLAERIRDHFASRIPEDGKGCT